MKYPMSSHNWKAYCLCFACIFVLQSIVFCIDCLNVLHPISDNYCLYVSAQNDTMSFDSALEECRQRFGATASLLQITSEAESQIIYDALPNNRRGKDIWLGLEKDSSGDFVWLDGTSTNFSNWKNRFPSSDSTHQCAFVKITNKMEWLTDTCDSEKIYTCKIPADGEGLALNATSEPTTVLTPEENENGTANNENGETTESVPYTCVVTTWTGAMPSNCARCGIPYANEMEHAILRNTSSQYCMLNLEGGVELSELANITVPGSSTAPSTAGELLSVLVYLESTGLWVNRDTPEEISVADFTQGFFATTNNLLEDDYGDLWQDLIETKDGAFGVLLGATEEVSNFVGKAANISEDVDYIGHNIEFSAKTVSADNIDKVIFKSSTSENEISVDAEKFSGDSNDVLTVTSILFGNPEKLVNKTKRVPVGDGSSNSALNSGIVSLSVFKDELPQSVPVRYKVANIQSGKDVERATIECVFWDFNIRSGDKHSRGGWSTVGCSVNDNPDMYTECICNHTTNFAVLLQFTEIEVADAHLQALDVITVIGCSVSILCLVSALTIYYCVGSLDSHRMRIHRNLAVALLLAQVLFISGVWQVAYPVLCKIIAVALHYLYLCVFTWMFIEGLHLYVQIVMVFGSEKNRMAAYYAIGWGLPVVVVAIALGARYDGYGSSAGHCWLSTNNGLIWAFVGPAIFVIVSNMIILMVVLKIVFRSKGKDKDGKYDHIRAAAKGAIILLPLLGTTWIFGLLAVNENLIVFQYLFAIFNSLQGFFIFFFHGVLSTEVRAALRRSREKHALSRGDFSTSRVMSTMNKSQTRTQTLGESTDLNSVKNLDISYTTAGKHVKIAPCNDVIERRSLGEDIDTISRRDVNILVRNEASTPTSTTVRSPPPNSPFLVDDAAFGDGGDDLETLYAS